MIKYTELRCGNKVHISGKEDPNERLVATVGEIHYFGSTLECDFGEGEGEEDCDIDHEDLIPIQLSEEWLIRAGFDDTTMSYGKSGERFSLFGFAIRLSLDNGYVFDDVYDLHIIRIVSVHQLQNLYFALTGEELTFKDL